MSESDAINDRQLLARYRDARTEEAFAELVRRHIDLVYSAALRQVRSPQLAEEVAQSVFADLARSATTLASDTIVTAWLYQVARRTAIDVVRREARRQLREQIATEMNATHTEAGWTHIEPLLDEAMAALDPTDRAAVLLRYFENKSLRAVGASLGTSDDAAQKRVSRAVDRLRAFLAKRGVAVGTSGLATILSANAVQAAPIGLAASISTAAALAGTSLATATTTIAMTTLSKTIVGATLAVAIGTTVFQVRKTAELRGQVQSLQQQLNVNDQRANEQQTKTEAELIALRDQHAQSQNNTSELLKLRAEVARLRATGAPASQSPDSVAASQTNNAPAVIELPKASWTDVGFASPQSTLQTRGWAVLTGNRERFKASVFITDGARQIMEQMLAQMIATAPEAERKQFSQQILDNQLGLEEGLLMPMMAENNARGYTGYQILAQHSPSDEEMILELSTTMSTGGPKKETMKLRRFGTDWKVVVDEDFISAQR